MSDLTGLDVSGWPTVRLGRVSVKLSRGADYICVSQPPVEPHRVAIDSVDGHWHLLTQEGLSKLCDLTNSDALRSVYRARALHSEELWATQALIQRDPEQRHWRADVDRLKRIHAEGNG